MTFRYQLCMVFEADGTAPASAVGTPCAASAAASGMLKSKASSACEGSLGVMSNMPNTKRLNTVATSTMDLSATLQYRAAL